jgi:hypothetical protein
MTSTLTPARPLSDPTTRGLHLPRALLMGLVRFAALTGATILYGLSITGGEDPVGAGLEGFMLTVALTGLWSLIDGWRRPLRTGAVAWALTSLLLVILGPLPEKLSYPASEGGWNGLGDYLAFVGDGFGVLLLLWAVPAAAGLVLGHLVRVAMRTTSPATARPMR